MSAGAFDPETLFRADRGEGQPESGAEPPAAGSAPAGAKDPAGAAPARAGDPAGVAPASGGDLFRPRTIGVKEQPPAVEQALRTPAKPFKLWSVERQVIEPAPARGERISIPRATREPRASASLPGRIEATRALVAFEPASALAKRGFRAYRALMRVALTRPYRRD